MGAGETNDCACEINAGGARVGTVEPLWLREAEESVVGHDEVDVRARGKYDAR